MYNILAVKQNGASREGLACYVGSMLPLLFAAMTARSGRRVTILSFLKQSTCKLRFSCQAEVLVAVQ